jgi:hypothetical protein
MTPKAERRDAQERATRARAERKRQRWLTQIPPVTTPAPNVTHQTITDKEAHKPMK